MNSMTGTLICALGGLSGAIFALPFRGIKTWKYESYWFVYALVGLVVFPWALASATCPNLIGVLSSSDSGTLARCFGFGALWGLGGLTWGLMIRYLGIGLGRAIGCGLCSATGTLIPPIVTGRAGDLVKDAAAVTTLASVFVSLAGIVLVGLAGKLKEGELSVEEKKKAVAEFDFRKGMTVAVFSGVASAGMNFGLQGGAGLEVAALRAGAASAWSGMPVLLVVLAGGFAVNAAWCLWQNGKNRSFGDYGRGVSPWFLAAVAGAVWAMQFVCQKVGEPAMGEFRYISFAVVMGSCVLFSSLLGVVLGEWKGTGAKTRFALASGIATLAVSIAVAVAAKNI
jgi:L-rhamnose-H+ transport protein